MSLVGLGQQSSAGFDPASVGGLVLWLDAADAATITLSGSNISRWADKSGNGYTMDTAPSGCSLPVRGAALNGLSTVGINTTSTGIKQSRVIPTFTNAFWVRKERDGNQGFGFYFGADTTYDFHTGEGGGSPPLQFVYPGLVPNGVRDASLTMFRVNGVTTGTLGGTSMPSTGQVNLVSISNMTGNARVQGLSYDRGLTGRSATCDWGEILLYSNALTPSQITSVEGYLARRWGIPTYLSAGHPYRSLGPVLRDFTPLDMDGLSLWLDAADATTLTLSGSTVTQWRDKSGNARNATPSGTGPTRGSNAVTFSGSQAMGGSATYLHSSNDGAWSAFAVFRPTSLAVGNPRLLTYQGTPNNVAQFLYVESGTLTTLAWLSGGASLTQAFGGSIVSNTTYLVGAVNSASTLTAYRNGVAGTPVSHGALTTSSNSTYVLGGFNSTDDRLTGDIYEVVVFSNALSTTQRQQVEAYLARKWGLQSSVLAGTSHPFRYGPAVVLPRQIPGCVLWLDSSDSASFTLSGSNVTTWNDKSGNGYNTSNLTGTATLSNNAVVFTGTQALGTNLSWSNSLNNHTMFAVVTYTTLQGAFVETNATTGTSGSGLDHYVSSSGQQSTNGWASAFQVRGATGITTGVRHLYGYTHAAGGSAVLYLNGTQTGSNTSAPSFASGGLVSLGNWKNGASYGDFFIGRIHEVLFYSSVLTTTQRQQLEGYLAWKWSVQSNLTTSNHPYYLSKALSVPFTPAQLPGLALWLDAADRSTLTVSGSSVTGVQDKSSNSLTMTVSGTAPGYLTTFTRGLPGFSFTGSQWFRGTFPSTYTGSTLTVFCVATLNSAAALYARLVSLSVLNSLDFNASTRTAILQRDQQLQGIATFRSGVASASASVTYNTPTLMQAEYTNTTFTLYTNGTSRSTSAASSAFEIGTVGIGYLADYGGSDDAAYWNGNVGEVLIYFGTVTTAQRQQIEGYLAAKWGLQSSLPSTHPYKSFRP